MFSAAAQAIQDITTVDNVATLTANLNQTTYGQLVSPYTVDQFTFSAAANTQIQFQLLATSAAGLDFTLTGPSGFTGFSDLTTSSSFINLPSTGTYTLTAHSTSGATGSYAFKLVQTALTPLTLNTPYDGTFAGSGEALLFTVSVTTSAPVVLQESDPSAVDHVEMYAKLGAPPTRADYGYGANGAGASPSIVVPSAAAGTWYILVYADSATAQSTFSLRADSSPVRVATVTPATYGANSVASLTLTGAGFTTAMTAALVSEDGLTRYPTSSVSFDTFTQLTAIFDLTGVPQGEYSVRVTDANGTSDTLTDAFTVTAAGQANLQTQADTTQCGGPTHRRDFLREVFEYRQRCHAGTGIDARILRADRSPALHAQSRPDYLGVLDVGITGRLFEYR